MSSAPSKPAQFFLHLIVPVICGLVLGFLFFGTEVFDTHSDKCQFLAVPLIASAFYFLLAFGDSRNAFAGLIVLYFINSLLTGSTTAIFIVRDVLYLVGLAVAVYGYSTYFHKSAHGNYLYTAVTMSGLCALTQIIASIIQLGIVRAAGFTSPITTVVSLASYSAFHGTMYGFAIGSGITISDKIFGAIESQTNQKS